MSSASLPERYPSDSRHIGSEPFEKEIIIAPQMVDFFDFRDELNCDCVSLNNFEGVAQLSLFLGQFETTPIQSPERVLWCGDVAFSSIARVVEYPGKS